MIVAVAAVAVAIVTLAQWVYPVKATPAPELNDRWRAWAREIRERAKSAPPSAKPVPSIPTVP